MSTSSSPSPQSLWPSQTAVWSRQRPSEHRNWSEVQEEAQATCARECCKLLPKYGSLSYLVLPLAAVGPAVALPLPRDAPALEAGQLPLLAPRQPTACLVLPSLTVHQPIAHLVEEGEKEVEDKADEDGPGGAPGTSPHRPGLTGRRSPAQRTELSYPPSS